MQRGRVTSWLAQRDFGFIQPASGGEDVWVPSSAFGGGTLTEGAEAWFETTYDQRTGKSSVSRVIGPAICRSGGRQVGYRNAGAALLEALAMIPDGISDPCTAVVAQTYADVLGELSQRVPGMIGDTSRQTEGEVLMTAALGCVRLITRCGPTTTGAKWWVRGLRRSLLAVVAAASEARPPTGARKAGAGGTPGADNGIRYTLGYSLEALRRSGDDPAFMEAAMRFPDIHRLLAAGRSADEALLLRRCHLTSRNHTF